MCWYGPTLNSLAGTDLVLPLSRHDLGIDTGDVDTSVQTGLVVSLDDITAVHLASSDTAVVGSLGTGEATLGPAIWPAIRAEKSVLLLETEPEVLVGMSAHQASSLVAVVVLVRSAVVVPGLAQDEDVVAQTERIREEGAGTQVDVGVVAGRLAGGRAVKVPFGQVLDVGHFLSDGLGLGADLADGVDPDVLGHDLAALRQIEVLFEV